MHKVTDEELLQEIKDNDKVFRYGTKKIQAVIRDYYPLSWKYLNGIK